MRVVAAMSGGVDSSVVAGLLVEQGHDVIGVHMKLHDAPAHPSVGAKRCCGVSDVLDVFDWGACLMARISARALPCLLAGLYVRRSCCLSAVDTTPGACLQECVLVRPLAHTLSADAANAADNVPAARSQITRDTLTLPKSGETVARFSACRSTRRRVSRAAE